MIAYLHYAAFAHHDNLVGILHGAEAVGHDFHGAAHVEVAQVLHNDAFVGGEA